MKRLLLILAMLLTGFAAWAQKPGSTPVKVSHEKQMVNGRKFYVHIVEKGQTVYSIARAYRVESFDAITHVDIHALQPGDTVWLPFRGQFSESEETTSSPAPVTVEKVYVHDTTYVNVPYAVHDTVYVNVPYAVHDTTYVPYAVHDTMYVDVAVHDTTYVNVPYAVHDTTYVPYAVHDTMYVDVAVHDTTVVTNTETKTEYVPVHDTTYITARDTVYIDAPYAVHDTTVVTNTVTKTEYVPVHDTTYINVPYAVHDSTIVSDTVTLTKYVTVRDTAYINVPYAVHDTTVVSNTVTKTEYVPVHDTTVVTDTVTLTKFVSVYDTTYITLRDTVYINAPYAVHDTTVVSNTVTRTEYVPVHDTTYITLRDTTIVTNTVTEYVTVHDTTYIKVPYAVHDTTYIVDTVGYVSNVGSDLAFASVAPVVLTDYVQAGPSAAIPESPVPAESQRKEGKTLRIALMMPLHLDQVDQISTSKFDIEQRGKRSYRQFEFIEFYEGVLLALDRLSEQGINVELNVVDVSDNSAAKVEEAFASHHVDKSDVVVALLLRDAFDKAAELSRQAGVYIVNPMTPRSELCAENPYMVKIQPSLAGMIALMLDNMKLERPDGHLYIIHSNAKAEKAAMDELKRQLTERGDIKYTIFNWSQSAKLATVLKATPSCNVVSIYEQGKDNNRVFSINLLNRLASIKKNSPTLYTLTDWTREYGDIDYGQLQLLNYHTFSQNWDMTNEVHVQFLQSFRNRFGAEPTSSLAATAYDLMLYVAGGLARHNGDFWQHPGPSLSTLTQPLHLGRSGAGLENDRAQLYRMENMRFVKALYK